MFFISCATICARGCSMFQFGAPFKQIASSEAFLIKFEHEIHLNFSSISGYLDNTAFSCISLPPVRLV